MDELADVSGFLFPRCNLGRAQGLDTLMEHMTPWSVSEGQA